MAALQIGMTIPLGDAGHVSLNIDVCDLAALTPQQRQVLADTGREFCDFAAATLNPAQLPGKAPASIHDPHGSVLDGVRGTRRNTS